MTGAGRGAAGGRTWEGGIRLGAYSLRWRLRPLAAAVVLLAVLTAALPFVIALGPGGLDAAATVAALVGQGSPTERLLVLELRLPRVLTAVAGGLALGVAGCLMQTLARNRLATPAILGVNEGATLAVMFSVFVTGTDALGPWWTAPLGALAAMALLLVLTGDIGSRGYRVLVIGLALSAVLRSTAELGLSWGELQHASAVYIWSMGSLNARGDAVTGPGMVLLGVVLVTAWLLARRLALLQFDEDSATSLGLDVRWCQLIALLLAVVLAGLAVGIAGPVGGPMGFIALASPIIARGLAGRPGVPLAVSGLIGALLVLGADTVGRVVVAPAELPAGAITSIVGGPFLIWVLLSNSREG
ncbi:iron ABC transporter permease [Aquisalimonas lutea]|uniref:FecCD family ABC transporter permease n=1 Tax=Aquisalimonas lutea TaxID=1327750 RepID=UPI0025B44AE6|nr:iron ABC transporter permease [Aquisalimonas lutea]MDN3518860.1 iron ABC transporter permease [Aquisalimonas lutea]